MSDSELEIKRLMALGHAREDIQILPDGQVTIVQLDQSSSGAETIGGVSARERLDKMMARLKELDYMAISQAVAGHSSSAEVEEEYVRLKADIQEALRLLGEKC